VKGLKVVAIALLLCVVLAGCAPGPNFAQNVPSTSGTIAGFFHGWWHGVISPITFVWSLVDPRVHIYEVHNNGAWYDFGFLIGVGVFFGGSRAASKNGKKK
jgi:hypothetical protein